MKTDRIGKLLVMTLALAVLSLSGCKEGANDPVTRAIGRDDRPKTSTYSISRTPTAARPGPSRSGI